AIFAGSFDPITKGHESVIEKSAKMFDKLIVAICINPEKHTLFSVEKRLKMINAVTKKYKNVQVCYHEGMLVDLMKEKGAIYNVRGVRNDTDYNYENNMHLVNSKLYKDIVTIFLPCSEEYSQISSTLVRNKIKNGQSLDELLSSEVIQVINEK
ncbi:MAG: pantetheine-phosphate adenylyltransferase, partial [Clostridia bacterium]|nr:pantetheine-phosphate adenylyltransferase [Clostridia bacterium]